MSRVMSLLLALALLAAGFLVGVQAGIGDAQPEIWSQPGDEVDDVPEADAALA